MHHGQNDYCIDKNYGGIPGPVGPSVRHFADERDDEKICYGIRKPLHSFSPIKGQPALLRRPVADVPCGKGLARQAGVWVAPPGGWTDEPIEHFEPAPLPALMCKPRAAALVRGAAVRGAGAFVSHFIGVAMGLDRGTAAGTRWAFWSRRWRWGAARAFCLGQVAGAGGLLALVLFAAVPQWFGPEAPSLLKVRCCGVVWGSVVWLNRRAVAPANAVGVAA
ncbi:MAG: hypothetical protein IPP41_10820 [Rhodocyclaceae bacterium]|nr:hypothetical protein [Rhodocyclaceae bacterium]